MNPLDLTTQRVQAIHIQNLEAQLQQMRALLEEAKKTIVQLEDEKQQKPASD